MLARSTRYSNLGAGLLSLALARRAGTDFETALRDRVFRPLGMKSTVISLHTRIEVPDDNRAFIGVSSRADTTLGFHTGLLWHRRAAIQRE